MRVKLRKAAFVYMVNDTDPYRMEKSAGLRCMLEDISDTGCAFMVKVQTPVGMRFKVQFSLDRIPICIPGTVRSVDYQQESNMSLIHMEADPLSVSVRNHIMCEVFNMLPDDDDEELPFRVQEEEVGYNTVPRDERKKKKKRFQEVLND
jgi:hypothetical protein